MSSQFLQNYFNPFEVYLQHIFNQKDNNAWEKNRPTIITALKELR